MALTSSVNTVNPDPSSAPEAIVLQALNDALNGWSNYIAGVGTLVVNVSFVGLGAPVAGAAFLLAEGGPASYALGNGGSTVANAAQVALSTGNQIASSDINITFNADLFPTITSESSYSLVSVLEHELDHGFGISGFLGNNASLQSGEKSRFDSLVQINPDGTEYFTGAAAERVYGGAVPLTTQVPGSDNYHLGATGTAADGSLFSDLMAPFLYPGATITPLDVAILADLGIPLTAAGDTLIDPNASLTATTGSAGGASVSDPLISGTTQAGELVTISVGGTVLGTVLAGQNGAWSFRASGLTDGSYFLTATVPTTNGTAAFGVPLILDATTPAVTAFQQILGRHPDAANIANLRSQLVNGTPLFTVRATLANGPEAAADVSGYYTAVLGRPAQAADLSGWKAALAGGSSLANLRAALASSPEAANAISNTYLATLGRAASAADVAGWQANFAAGQGLPQLQAILGASPESQAAVTAAYRGELGRAPSSADLAGWAANLSNGGTLTNLHTLLGASSEARTAINTTYQSVLGRAAQAADTAGWQLNLEVGQTLSSLRAILAGSGEAAGDITNAYQAELGRAPSATELAAAQQSLAAGTSLSGFDTSLATGPEAQSDLTSSFSTALGHAPDPLQVAGGESELLSGFTLSQVQGQIAALGTGSVSPIVTGTFAPITPETIQPVSGPQMVYGLPDNVIADLSASTSVTSTKTLGGDSESINQFNPATDFLLIPAKFDSGGFVSLQSTFFDIGGGTALYFRQGPAGVISNIVLEGAHPAQLTASNFHFV